MPTSQSASVNTHYIPPTQRSMSLPNDAALRRSRKPTDKNMPDGIEDMIIGEGVQQYKSLRDLEKRLDAAVIRKRLDIQDSISKMVKKYQTLRIWISNTVENQPWQQNASGQNGTGFSPGGGRYKVRIEGRLLDDDESDTNESADEDLMQQDGGADAAADREKKDVQQSLPKKPSPRFSQFFKSISIDFDNQSSVNTEVSRPIVWAKPQAPVHPPAAPLSAEFDAIQFSRTAQENLNVTVSLVRDETPERYKLSKELAEVLDVEEETRSGIILGIWDYIRAMGLQEDEEKRQVRCDQRLRAVLLTTL